MDRPRRKSVSAVNYSERERSPIARGSRRSMRKTVGNEIKNPKDKNEIQDVPKTSKSVGRRSNKPEIAESSESEDDSPIEISDDEETVKSTSSRRSLRKTKSCNELKITEKESPKKIKLSRNRTPSMKALESITTENSPTVNAIECPAVRQSSRYKTPSKVRFISLIRKSEFQIEIFNFKFIFSEIWRVRSKRS